MYIQNVSKKYWGCIFNFGLKIKQHAECMLHTKACIKYSWLVGEEKKNIKPSELNVSYPFTYQGPEEEDVTMYTYLTLKKQPAYKQKLIWFSIF